MENGGPKISNIWNQGREQISDIWDIRDVGYLK